MVAFTSGSVLTAANLNTAFNQLTTNVQTGTSYTTVLTDQGGLVTLNNASAIAVTVPLNSSVAYATGTIISLLNLGAGTVTVAGAGGVTVNGTSLTLAQNEAATLVKIGTNTWNLVRGGSGLGAANFTNTATGTYSSGGTNYKYLTFTGTANLVIDKAGLIDVLCIAGGAGGGMNFGGGGGAGGYVNFPQVYIPTGTHTVTVGGGGAGSSSQLTQGAQGGNAAVWQYYATTGGGGGSLTAGNFDPMSGAGGGSGGGSSGFGRGFNAPAGVGSAWFGNNGGQGSTTAGGGGGGATAAGVTSVGNTGGAGGAGTASSITNTSVTRAGGGGGGGNPTGGAGGAGGGGAAGVAGTANTGSGGGGGGNAAVGAAGGSGVVIVRVAY